jgi:L-ascorbate metabolism protein UlaG (beta-lactamase superfamily)
MPLTTRQNVAPDKLLEDSWSADCLALAWLGQAGFLMRSGRTVLLIDPYLSDSLAIKYRGTKFPHTRMMPPPLAPEQIDRLDWVLCTHDHTDHMDPGTLGVLARQNPECRFVVPRAAMATAIQREVPSDRIVAIAAGEEHRLSPEIAVSAVASAPEEVVFDDRGDCVFLGFVLRFPRATVYHSGDCAPYDGLAADLSQFAIDLALLPVNGRDAMRRAGGILGNFTFGEATQLCRDVGIDVMIACHFGMFDFNTVDVEWLDRQIAQAAAPRQCIRPRVGEIYEFTDSSQNFV